MPTTDRLGWLYPTEEQKDWWSIFVARITQMDADVWASFENAYLVLDGGGVISLNTSTDVLSWTSDLYVRSTLTGGSARIPAGSVTLEDANTAYIDITRPLSSSYDTTMQVTSTPLISAEDQRNTVFVAIRSGSQLILRPFQGGAPDTLAKAALFSDQKDGVDGGDGGNGTVSGVWWPRSFQNVIGNPFPTDLELMSWDITALDDGGGGGPYVITVEGDQTAYFPDNRRIDIRGSTSNDNDATATVMLVTGTSYTGGNTEITVNQSIDPAVVDGTIYNGMVRFLTAGTYRLSGYLNIGDSASAAIMMIQSDGASYLASGCNDGIPATHTPAVGLGKTTATDGVNIPFSWKLTVSADDVWELWQYGETQTGTGLLYGEATPASGMGDSVLGTLEIVKES